METLLILFVGGGLLLAALSAPLILRKIGPNPLYGFRVKRTLEDPTVWYPVNACAAKRLLVVGLVLSVSAIGEAEGEVRVLAEWNHLAFFLSRISANFSLRLIALIAASRFKAEL
jgi:SdpI/YfhL protein family